MTTVICGSQAAELAGMRVALVGRLAGMNRRDAQQLIRDQGGIVADAPSADLQIIVVGEQELPLSFDSRTLDLDDPTRSAIDAHQIEVITETQLWQRLGRRRERRTNGV